MDLRILLAFIPFIGWAFGDFYIQKCSRKLNSIETIFYISLFCMLLTPFVWQSLLLLTPSQLVGLTGLSVLVFFYAFLLFQAFKASKLSVIESIIALELPLTVAITIFVGKETVTTSYLIFFLIICFGVFLASTKSFANFAKHKNIFEKGVLLGIFATVLSSLANYYIGLASQQTSPLITIWFMHFVLLILSLIYLTFTRNLKNIYFDFSKNKKTILLASFFDILGWSGYMYAVTVMPISLTITISESYIILAAFLGYYYNKERLDWHQKIGAFIAIVSVIILSLITKI